jgi:parallel beta helix pectate lyase-like protein
MRILRLVLVAAIVSAVGGARSALSETMTLELHGSGETVIRVPGYSSSAPAPNRGRVLSARTIAEAARLAMVENSAGRAARILIAPGVYRESCVIDRPGAGPLTIEAEVPGSVVMTGADVWRAWSPVRRTALWSHPWPEHFQPAPIPIGWESQDLQPIVLRREMVFEGDDPLTQVLTREEASARAGSFFVDDDASTLYVHPRSLSSDPTLSVAIRPQVLSVKRRSQVVVRGIVFKGAPSAIQNGAVELTGVTDVSFEDCRFERNSWTGLTISDGRHISIRRCRSEDNGGPGVTIWRTRGLSVSDLDLRANNWRGAAGNFVGWAVAGLKALKLHDAHFERLRAIGNLTRGLWFDTDCSGITLNNCALCRNLTDGLFAEVSQGPISVNNTMICANGGVGLLGSDAAQVEVRHSRLCGNRRSQIVVSGQPYRPREATDWETGQTFVLRDQSWSWFDNFIGISDPGQLLVDNQVDRGVWNRFVETLRSDRNVWSAPAETRAFVVAGGSRSGLQGWQESTGQDEHSKLADSEPTRSQSRSVESYCLDGTPQD